MQKQQNVQRFRSEDVSYDLCLCCLFATRPKIDCLNWVFWTTTVATSVKGLFLQRRLQKVTIETKVDSRYMTRLCFELCCKNKIEKRADFSWSTVLKY